MSSVSALDVFTPDEVEAIKKACGRIVVASMYGLDPRAENFCDQVLQDIQVRDSEGDALAIWDAIEFIEQERLALPAWVVGRLGQVGRKIGAGLLSKGRGNTEAERVGRALGFGTGGRGQTSRGERRSGVYRDRRCAFDIEMDRWCSQALGKHFKLEAAVLGAMSKYGLARSSVMQAYRRQRTFAEDICREIYGMTMSGKSEV